MGKRCLWLEQHQEELCEMTLEGLHHPGLGRMCQLECGFHPQCNMPSIKRVKQRNPTIPFGIKIIT